MDARMRQKMYEAGGHVKGDIKDFVNTAIELYLERLDALDRVVEVG